MKIFGIGLIKTGTTTLGHALKMLGYNHYDGSYQSVNQLSLPYISGNLDPIYEVVQQYDSFDDFPFCAPKLFKTLNLKYPDSKFVLTVRESESWYGSLNRYFDPNFQESNLLKISQRASELPIGRFYGLLNCMLATFETFDLKDKDLLLEKFQEYNHSVAEYFKGTSKLLVIDWSDGDNWEKLCPFLNKPVLNLPFPRANRSD